MRGKAAVPLLCAGALALLLSGCSALGFLFGPDQGEVDLVVVNDSTAVLGTVTVTWGQGSGMVTQARDQHALERGESYGFALDGLEQGQVTVEFLDMEGRLVSRCALRYGGQPLFVTLRQDGTVQVEETTELPFGPR